MDFIKNIFKFNNEEIRALFNKIISQGKIPLQRILLSSDSILKANSCYIYKIINFNILNLSPYSFSLKKKKYLRNINYLKKKIKTRRIIDNIYSKYKLTNKNATKKLIINSLLVIFYLHVYLQNFKKPENSQYIYYIISKIYQLLKIMSLIISKLYFDKIFNIDETEIILKLLIIFSINNFKNNDIKTNNNIENIMYLKEFIKIVKIIYNCDTSAEEKNLLTNIFKYMNNSIFYLNENKDINYTNKFYMLNNDKNTTKLLSLMNIIHKNKNDELNNAYFELLSNIYYFQCNYHNFFWPIYKLLEPLLVNIDKKSYTTILNEISFTEFEINFMKYFFKKEKELLSNYTCLLKNGFYFGEFNNNSGIIAEIDKVEDNYILTFGFKLILKEELLNEKEFIILQFKNINDNKTELKLSIIQGNGLYMLFLIDNKKKKKPIFAISPNNYYIFSFNFQESNLYISFIHDKFDEVGIINMKKTFYKPKNAFVCVGCDVEQKRKKNKLKYKNYKYLSKFTGFIGDIHIINTKSFNPKNIIDKIKDKNAIIDTNYYLQNHFLKLKGKYGYAIVKSILEQKIMNEYITSNIEKSTRDKYFETNNTNDFFNIYIKQDTNKEYKIIDNIALYISSLNFKLINYMDNIDYLNYKNNYYEKEKDLKSTKSEYQYFINYRIKRDLKDLKNNKKIGINTKLFNSNFNIFENKSGILTFIEEDGIFFLILILEYYYQIIYKIKKNISKMNKENNLVNANNMSNEQKYILEYITKYFENIIKFFHNRVFQSKTNIKQYKMKLFYYQINIVMKELVLIHNINDNIYSLLLKFLEEYQILLNKFVKQKIPEKDYFIDNRNCFFDLLLNPNLYKINKNFNLLKNLDELFLLLNQIIEENIENEILLQNIILKKILNLAFIFKMKNGNNKQNNEQNLFNVQKNYSNLLFNFIKYFFSKDKSQIINNFRKIIEENDNNYIIFYYLSYAIYKSKIIEEVLFEYIEFLVREFEINYLLDNENSKNISKFALSILIDYKVKKQIDDLKKIKQIQNLINKFDVNDIFIYLIEILNIILSNLDKEIINYNGINNKITILDNLENENVGKYIDLFLKLIISLIDENYEIISRIYQILTNYNINKYYEIYKYIILIVIKTKNIKLFKKLLSSENNILPIIFYNKLIYSENDKEISLIEEDIIEIIKELLLSHNYPFIFKLLEMLSYNINFTENEMTNNFDNKNYVNIKICINIINSVYDILKNYNLDLTNKKKNKYYIRNIINLLIIIYNIYKKKDNLYLNNETLKKVFINLVKLIEKINLIYSNYCIKIDNYHGQLISELIFNSFMVFIVKNNDKEIMELFKEIFIKNNNKINDEKITLFYLIDLLKFPNLDEDIKAELQNCVDDISEINSINNLLKTKKDYNLDSFDIRKSLPNYKCIKPIIKANLSIYFVGLISIYLYHENKVIEDKDFIKFLLEKFIPLLNHNIEEIKINFPKYYNNDIYEDFESYSIIKQFYDDNFTNDISKFISFVLFLKEHLPIKLKSKSKYKVEFYCSSFFIWKENIEKENNKNEHNIPNDGNIKTILNEIISLKNKISKKDEEKDIIKFIKEELNNINENSNILHNNPYYCFLDDLNNRCCILVPKHTFIKRIFSHIYYKLIFYDKSFMYIKNKYFRRFPGTNINTKQLNYPSKVKNYSNFYEPKIFLKRDFNFYDDNFLKISHDYLYEKTKMSDSKEIETFFNENLSLVNFYEHTFDIKEVLEEKDKSFDCELVTNIYVYCGFIIFGSKYIYYDKNNEIPKYYEKNDIKDDFDINLYLKYYFSLRDQGNDTKKRKKLIIFYQDIKCIIKRRVMFKYYGFEIFLRNGKSYFFNLFSKKNCENAFNIITTMRDQQNESDKFRIITENINEEIRKINDKVKEGAINNYFYLSQINFFSSRTFNDITQYPIFPWIILNYDKLDKLLDIEKKKILANNNISTNNFVDENEDNDNDNLIIDIKNILLSETENEKLFYECGLRQFNYPLSVQIKEKRKDIIFLFNEGEEKFKHHHGSHYSTSAFVFFYMMRNSPFTQGLIKLQNNAKENPNRLFNEFSEALLIFKSAKDNRELIPNLFCHFDYCVNLNCTFNNYRVSGEIIDDLYGNFDINVQKTYSNDMLSIYSKFIFLFRKLLNSNLISEFLPFWLDNIFGKNQLPKNPKYYEESCNIFGKSTYEEKMNLDEKIMKYKKKLDNNEITKKQFANKINKKLTYIRGFGMTPRKVLDKSIKLKTTTIFNKTPNVFCEINNNIIFVKSNFDIIILFKNDKVADSDKIKNIYLWNQNNNNNIVINRKTFNKIKSVQQCGYIKELNKIKLTNNKSGIHKIPIFKPCYIMSKFVLLKQLFIVTCRYLGNIFKIQNIDYHIDVLCEDFVTCIICQDTIRSNLDDNIIIYSGLKNGKLIEWSINKRLNSQGKINIKERKSCYCHKAEITCLELYENQNIIITGGIDKMIFIRKTYDFELLTVINLIYSYANPIVGEKINIIPTLIKVSKLNSIYIMLYNYKTKKSFIRGYNLNGLLFAQSEEKDYMNICFTKNDNLLTSIYNETKIFILNCYDLKTYNIKKNNTKIENYNVNLLEFLKTYNENKEKKEEKTKGYLIWFDYNVKSREFILLFEDIIIKGSIEDLDNQKELEFY